MVVQKKPLSSLTSLLGGFALLLAGAFTLSLSIPHSDPWRMLHIDVLYWATPHLTLQPPFLPGRFTLPMIPFLSLIGLFVLATPFLTAGGRRILSSMTSGGLSFPLTIAWSIIFVMTFMPGLRVGGIYSRSVAVYLTLGLFGSILVWTGIVKVLRLSQRWEKGLTWWTGLYEPVRIRVFSLDKKYFLGVIFLLNFLLTNLVSYYCFEHIPHVQDSIAQFFHGMIFAQGNLVAVSHPLKEFFDFTHMINDGQWYSQYPPGHSALLAVGVLAGVPWMVNPLLGSATVLLFYFLGKELYGESIGHLAAILGLLSPLILFMSSEFMNHASSLFFFTLFLLYGAKVLKSGKVIHGLVAGGAIGWVFLIRPLTAIGAGLPLLLYGGVQLIRHRKALASGAFALIGAASVFILLLLTFNYLTNGDPLLFGFQVLYGDNVLPGFGHSAWGTPHTFLKGVYQTLDNLLGMNKHLFEWPLPSLALVIVLFTSQTTNKWDFILLGSAFSLAVAYLFYWYQDWCFGPRFLYEAAGPFILLTARGIDRVPRLMRSLFGSPTSVRNLTALTAFLVGVLFIVGLATNVPSHLTMYGERYWGVNGRALKAAARLKKAIVFTRGNYGGVFTANKPDLSNDVIFVRDRGNHNVLLMEYYQGYSFYLLNHDMLGPYSPREQ